MLCLPRKHEIRTSLSTVLKQNPVDMCETYAFIGASVMNMRI